MIFGEIALMNPKKRVRTLSAMTKNDCILLILNTEAFDIIVKEKLKREREDLGRYVHENLPTLKDNFSLYSVLSTVHVVFKPLVILHLFIWNWFRLL